MTAPIFLPYPPARHLPADYPDRFIGSQITWLNDPEVAAAEIRVTPPAPPARGPAP